VFDSDRPGTLGGPDIWASPRRSLHAPWSLPVNLGANVNSVAAETRASFADHGRTLYFGSTRPGGEGASDLCVTTREGEHDGAAAIGRAATPAQLALARTLNREHHAYPAPTGKSTNTQPTEPSGASPLLAAVGLVGLTMLLAAAVAFLWLRGRARAREAT
jgi:hypothetical protein